MPAVFTKTYSEPDEFERAYSKTRVQILPTARGAFRARAAQAELGTILLHGVRESSPHIKYVEHNADRVFIRFLPHDGQGLIIEGVDLPASAVAISRGGQSYFERVIGPSSWDSLSLPTPDLVQAGASLAGHDLSKLPHRTHASPTPSAIVRLRQLHSEIFETVAEAPEGVLENTLQHSLEQAVISTVIACLIAALPSEIGASHRHQTLILRRFQGVLERYPDKPLYLPEICVAIGASERTLRRVCQDHFGVGPKYYLHTRRMHLARRALRGMVFPLGSVTEVATRFGFWHLGRFSAQYRTLFGELPSETLRAPPQTDRDQASVAHALSAISLNG